MVGPLRSRQLLPCGWPVLRVPGGVFVLLGGRVRREGGRRVGGAQCSMHCWVEAVWGFFSVLEHLSSWFCSSCFPAQSALPVFPPISSCTFFISPGKDARLFVFRLSAVHKAIEGKQPVKSRCDCRDNKLEKTKGDHSLRCLGGFRSVLFLPQTDQISLEFGFLGLVFTRKHH